MFEYDHGFLSIVKLQQKGIRSVRELEEVIEGYSFAKEEFYPELGYSVIIVTGFSRISRPLKIACRVDYGQGKLTLLDVDIPTVGEIVRDFCVHCQ